MGVTGVATRTAAWSSARRVAAAGAAVVVCALLCSPVAALAAPRPPAPAGVHVLAPGQLPGLCTEADYNSGAMSGAYYDSPSHAWLSAPYCILRWGNLEASPPQLAEAGKPVTVTAIPNQGSNSGTYAPETNSIAWTVGGKVVSGCGSANLTCTFIPAPKRTHVWQWVEVHVTMPRTFFVDSPGSYCAGQHLCPGVQTNAWTWIGVPPDICPGRTSARRDAPPAGPIAVAADNRNYASQRFLHCLSLYTGVQGASFGFFGVLSATFGPAAVTAVGAPEAAPFMVPLGKASGIVGAGFGLASITLEALANDPPDAHYKQLARPRIGHPPLVPTTGTLGQQVGPAINALLEQQAEQAGISRALELSRNRAGGAHRAHNRAWERRQMLAVARYSAALAKALGRVAPGMAAAAAAVRPTVLGGLLFTSANAEQARADVAAHGLPSSVVASLKGVGATPASISGLAKSVQTASAQSAPLSFDAAFNDPNIAAACSRAAGILRSYAKRVKAHPSVSQT